MIIRNPTLKAQMKTIVHQVIPVLIWMSTIQRNIRNLSISKQKQIDRKHFLTIFTMTKYNNASQISKTRKFHGLKEKPGLSLIITRYSENFLKTTEKAEAGLQERLRISMSDIFSVKLIETDHYQLSLNVN